MSHPIESLDPHKLALTRRAPGGYVAGSWRAGRETALTILATVQTTDPRTLILLPEGKRSKSAWTIHTLEALQALNEKTGQPADLVWIDGRPYEISLSWDHTRRSSELAYFKAVVTEINTVSGPSDFALAGETIDGPDLPLCYRPTTKGDGRLYVFTDTEEDARGYVGPSRSGAAPGETVSYTLAGNVHSSITGTPGLELYAYKGAYISDLAEMDPDTWTIGAGTLASNGLNVSKGAVSKASAGAVWDYCEIFDLVADQASYVFGEGTSQSGDLGAGARTDAASALVQWGATTLIPDLDYAVAADRLILSATPSAEQAAAGEPLTVRIKTA